jgi:addiction module HigA family antidote
MEVHSPAHPGEIVREECLKPLGLTVTAAAEALGITRKALSDLLNGHTGVSPDMAIRLEKVFAARPIPGCGCGCSEIHGKSASARTRSRSRDGLLQPSSASERAERLIPEERSSASSRTAIRGSAPSPAFAGEGESARKVTAN